NYYCSSYAGSNTYIF
nr:immunoglobulin light chain junction region [Macaca mulatta]MOW16225.1 immunoglobulin light chain junction region [Macaca mulatta]MOW17088.1 immunoglobulin light chain junction region [Macaca mulatta]MOW18066.1 immunoglobulin light chain junction region [Macaca mulatta]MOW60237.1 immunoglobulin light chain junction region [Macaca mulatta]